MSALLGVGVGAVGHGGERGRHELLPLAERHEWCAANDHPGHTFNPWQIRTWCLCGAVVRNGDTVAWPKSTDCGGPLVICHHTQTTRPRSEVGEALGADGSSTCLRCERAEAVDGHLCARCCEIDDRGREWSA